MFDVIECLPSVSPNKQIRVLVFQSRSADLAASHAEQLWRTSTAASGSASTFVVVDRCTARELCRVPKR
jgi:hypothetical protein